MNIRVKDYLEDLSNADVPRENGMILLDDSAFVDNCRSEVHLKNNVRATYIGNNLYYSNYYT